jgi:hypothetical protein
LYFLINGFSEARSTTAHKSAPENVLSKDNAGKKRNSPLWDVNRPGRLEFCKDSADQNPVIFARTRLSRPISLHDRKIRKNIN